MPNLENRRILHFEFQCQKLLRLYHNTYILLFCIDLYTKRYRGLWFNPTHLPLFQNMSVKIYTKFFLSSYLLILSYFANITDEWRDECRRMRDKCRRLQTSEDKWETSADELQSQTSNSCNFTVFSVSEFLSSSLSIMNLCMKNQNLQDKY